METETKTQKELFLKYLAEHGFEIPDDERSILYVRHHSPACYKTIEGDIILPSDVHVTLFEGTDTKKGYLGCIIFYRIGSRRKKYHKDIQFGVELFKYACCPNEEKTAIKEFEQWTCRTIFALSQDKRLA